MYRFPIHLKEIECSDIHRQDEYFQTTLEYLFWLRFDLIILI